jgi:hypothetical protein
MHPKGDGGNGGLELPRRGPRGETKRMVFMRLRSRNRWLGTSIVTAGFFSAGALWLLGHGWLFPSPQKAPPAALQRWLVLRDMTELPYDVQLALVDRIQTELSPDELLVESRNSSRPLPSHWRSRLQRNVAWLKRVWFEARASQYCQLSGEERREFLETQIDFLFAWAQGLAALRTPAEAGEPSEAWQRFFDELAQWTREAPAEKRSCLEQAMRDGVICWLATTDVADLPRELRISLARRFAAELRGASGRTPPSGESLSLEPAHRAQLERNAWRLAEAWFHQLAGEFAELPHDEQSSFVDARIDEVLSWNLGAYLGGVQSRSLSPRDSRTTRDRDGSSPLGRLVQWGPMWEEVARWVPRAEPEFQPCLEQFLHHLQRRMVARALGHPETSVRPAARGAK